MSDREPRLLPIRMPTTKAEARRWISVEADRYLAAIGSLEGEIESVQRNPLHYTAFDARGRATASFGKDRIAKYQAQGYRVAEQDLRQRLLPSLKRKLARLLAAADEAQHAAARILSVPPVYHVTSYGDFPGADVKLWEDDLEAAVGWVGAVYLRAPGRWFDASCSEDLARLASDLDRNDMPFLQIIHAHLEPGYHGRGMGIAMYAEMARLAATRYQAALVPDVCGGVSVTSPEAWRVWRSRRLARYVARVGHAIYWTGPGDLDVVKEFIDRPA